MCHTTTKVLLTLHPTALLKTSCIYVHTYTWVSECMCCSVLQCVAECCSVLQCVAVCCSVLQLNLWYDTLHLTLHPTALLKSSCRYSQSHLGWHFRMLFQSSKLKAWTSLLLRFSEKSHSSFELWTLKKLSKMSPHMGLAVYRALWSVYRAHLSVHGALFSIYRALFENVTPRGIGCTYIHTRECQNVWVCDMTHYTSHYTQLLYSNHMHSPVCMYAFTYVHAYIHTGECLWVCVYMYLSNMYVLDIIFIYMHTYLQVSVYESVCVCTQVICMYWTLHPYICT